MGEKQGELGISSELGVDSFSLRDLKLNENDWIKVIYMGKKSLFIWI